MSVLGGGPISFQVDPVIEDSLPSPFDALLSNNGYTPTAMPEMILRSGRPVLDSGYAGSEIHYARTVIRMNGSGSLSLNHRTDEAGSGTASHGTLLITSNPAAALPKIAPTGASLTATIEIREPKVYSPLTTTANTPSWIGGSVTGGTTVNLKTGNITFANITGNSPPSSTGVTDELAQPAMNADTSPSTTGYSLLHGPDAATGIHVNANGIGPNLTGGTTSNNQSPAANNSPGSSDWGTTVDHEPAASATIAKLKSASLPTDTNRLSSNSLATTALVNGASTSGNAAKSGVGIQANTVSGGGTLYVSTPLSYPPIAQVSSTGSVSSFTSNSSQLNNPQGVAFSLQGNLYVANNGSNTIEEFSQSGIDLGTFANTGLSSPAGLIFDSANNLYVANQGNNTIEKFTIHGSGSVFVPSTAGLDNPQGMALDASGNLYAASYSNNTIYKITPSGSVSVFVSGGSLNLPFGLAFDSSGNLYVSNSGSGQILEFASAGGTLSTSPTLFASEGTLADPQGLAFDNAGDLFVALNITDRIEEYTSTGGVLSPSGMAFVTGLNDPEFLAVAAAPVPTPGIIWMVPVGAGVIEYLRRRRIL
jgi:sugar lactone lactonase YvrE